MVGGYGGKLTLEKKMAKRKYDEAIEELEKLPTLQYPFNHLTPNTIRITKHKNPNIR